MSKKVQPLSFREFIEKHKVEFAKDDTDPALNSAAYRMGARAEKPASMPEWMVRILKAAGKDNCPSAYGSFVQAWLEGIGAKPPAGMSIELQARGAPGRPRSDYTERVFACWVAIGQPSVYKSTLARAFYGKEFTTADAQQRKRLVDRCRRAVERRQPGAVASPE